MKSITLAQVQAEVDGYIGQCEDGYWHPLANLARLTEEVGELARWLNHRYGEKSVRAEEAQNAAARMEGTGMDPLAEEVGDILFVLACIANAAEISLGASFHGVMAKVKERDGARWTPRARAGDDPAID